MYHCNHTPTVQSTHLFTEFQIDPTQSVSSDLSRCPGEEVRLQTQGTTLKVSGISGSVYQCIRWFAYSKQDNNFSSQQKIFHLGRLDAVH